MDYRGWLHHQHPASPSAGAPDERRLRTVLIAASMAIFAVQLDFFALNLALPGMASELGVTTTDAQWVISGYMLALAAFLIPGGRLGDLLGRRRMLIVGLAIFGGASLLGGLAPSLDWVIAARVIQGVGAGILFPVSVAVISNAFPPERRMRAIGNVYGLAATATAIGPFVGGALTELFDWRAVLLINIPISAITIFLVLRSVEESRDQSAPRSIDFPGVAAITLGIAAVTLAVDRSEAWGLISWQALGLLGLGVALLVAFVKREQLARYPLVDLVLFRNRPYVGVTLLGTIANTAFVCTTFAVTLYLQQAEGYSPVEAGLIFIAASLPLALTGPASGWLAERTNVPRTMVVASAIGAIGLIGLAAGPELALYMVAMALYGGGYGLGWSMASVGTQGVVKPERAGEASGVTLAIVIGTAGLAVAIVGATIDSATAGGASLAEAIEDILRVIAIATVILSPAVLLATRAGGAGAEADS